MISKSLADKIEGDFLESPEKINELKAKIQNLNKQINSMKIQHNCFLNKLKNYIDAHNENSSELEDIYIEAKNSDDDCEEFSQVSMDSFHASQNVGSNPVSAISKVPISEEEKQDIPDLQKMKSCNQKSNPYRTSCKIVVFFFVINQFFWVTFSIV